MRKVILVEEVTVREIEQEGEGPIQIRRLDYSTNCTAMQQQQYTQFMPVHKIHIQGEEFFLAWSRNTEAALRMPLELMTILSDDVTRLEARMTILTKEHHKLSDAYRDVQIMSAWQRLIFLFTAEL